MNGLLEILSQLEVHSLVAGNDATGRSEAQEDVGAAVITGCLRAQITNSLLAGGRASSILQNKTLFFFFLTELINAINYSVSPKPEV